MKKNLLALLVAAVLCLSVILPVCGAETGRASRLHDGADLFTDGEEATLLSRLDEISRRLQFDVVIVTSDDLGGRSYVDVADDYFDYNGFGFGTRRDGALLLISVDPSDRICYISTSGYGITALTDAAIDSMLDIIVDDYFHSDAYFEAAGAFAELCDRFVTQAKNADTNDHGSLSRAPFSGKLLLKWLGISAAIGLGVAWIRISLMKQSMKTVFQQAAANRYYEENSLKITSSSERFLYRNVTRVKRQTDSGSSGSGGSRTHRSSSGASHGGGGRR